MGNPDLPKFINPNPLNLSPQGLEMMQAFSKASQALMAGMKPVLEHFNTVGKTIYDAAYANYLRNGAIYGESHEGFMRYVREVNEVERMRRRADEIELHHQTLRELRARLKRS